MASIRLESMLRSGLFPSNPHTAPVDNENTQINVLVYVAMNSHISMRGVAEDRKTTHTEDRQIIRDEIKYLFLSR